MQARPIPPSAFGFRSILPRSRYERFSLKDKVSLERNRINQRVGWQARMHQQNAPDTSAMLTSCPTNAAGYLSNADRFHTDTAGDEFVSRQDQNRKKQAADDFRRNMTSKREEDRWVQSETKQKAEEEYWSKLREDGSKAQKNQSLMAFDILNLEYTNTPQGEIQKYRDDMVRVRAAARSVALVEKGDTRVPYNIISGTERPPLQYPESIQKPQVLLQQQQQQQNPHAHHHQHFVNQQQHSSRQRPF